MNSDTRLRATRASGLFRRSISSAAMNWPSRSLSWFITKRLKPMEWSSSQWKLSIGSPATRLRRSAWML
ncbi:hypothetical protein D3C73_1641470 [compost metagenome]